MTTRDEMIEELTDLLSDGGYYAHQNAEAILDGNVELSGGARLMIARPFRRYEATDVVRQARHDNYGAVDELMGMDLFRAWQPEGSEDR
jgi:hypothetical protein